MKVYCIVSITFNVELVTKIFLKKEDAKNYIKNEPVSRNHLTIQEWEVIE